MKYSFCLASFLLASTLVLSGCSSNTQNATAPASSPAASPVASPNQVAAQPSSSPASASANSPTSTDLSYREANGLFEISFPEGYTYEETGSGISFVSGDQSFGGSVDFGPAQGQQFTTAQLEDSLKEEYTQRLDQVAWQGNQLQPDGSIRVDWVGRSKDGNDLDAVSFVEQHGDTIFILNLFGINKPYTNYTADAEAIVGTYRVRQN